MASSCKSKYSRRKQFLPEYSQLFEVLLKIPDKEVQSRVTDAINGVTICSVCKWKESREIGTQTDCQIDTMEMSAKINGDAIDMLEDKPKQSIERKRRKRKRTCPKVVKTAQLPSTTPVLKQDTVTIARSEETFSKKTRAEIEDINFECSFESFGSIDSQSNENIQKQMIIEYKTCLQFTDGRLPIHQAITENDLNKLRRQIYVFKFLNTNLMELLTEDDYNIIQLAVSQNCYKFIIEEILNQESVHLKDVDDEHNTIIHMAVEHLSCDDDPRQQKPMLQSFELLLRKFDLEMLLEKNNDGMTALHLAVRENKYLMVEKMLNVIDDMLQIKSIDPIPVSNPTPNAFIEYYNKQCNDFEDRQLHKLKSKILNATDMKGGCTALYFAMEKKYDHIIYLLLAHMCDPRIKNFAGIDPKSYYTDHGKNAIIVGILEKVIQVLQKEKNL